MQNTSNSAHHAVLASYAAASQRADARIALVQEQYQPALTAAKHALREAKDNQVKAIEAAYERAFYAIMRTFEQAYRKAHNVHGTSITTVLRAHDARVQTIGAERDSKLSEARAWYELLCSRAPSNQDPSCLPAYDNLRQQEVEADQVQAREIADSHAIYLAEKELQDRVLAQEIERATSEKRQGIETAEAERDRQIEALLPPLQEAVAAAQADFDRAMQEATSSNNQARASRLSIIGALEAGRTMPHEAIKALDRLQ